jgi:hypothetical protein
MSEPGSQSGTLINAAFLLITGFIAYHAISYRDEHGKQDWVRLLFGCIALTYFLLVLFSDILGLIPFGLPRG